MALILSGDTGVPASGMPTGSVIQTVTTTKTDTFTMTGQTMTTITGLTATITPISTTSKVLVIVSIGGFGQGTGQGRFVLQRNSADISGAVGAAGSGQLVDTFTIGGIASGAVQTTGGTTYLDSPASTSALTYSVTVSSNDAGQGIYINRSPTDTANTSYQRNISTITLMEIKA